MTKPTKPAKQRIITTLSMEMMGIPESEQCMIYEHFEEAIAKGIFLALQDSTETFEATYVNLAGETVTEIRREEHVETNDAWTKWLAEQRLASKYHVIRTRREYTTNSKALTEDANAFEVIANMRRDDLIAQRQAEETRLDKPAAKPKSGSKAPQKPQPTVSQEDKKPGTQTTAAAPAAPAEASRPPASEPSSPVKTNPETAHTPVASASSDSTAANAND